MVKVFQNLPGSLLDLVAGKDHVHTGLDGIFDFDGQDTCVAMQILGLSLEPVKSVRILQIQCCDASHIHNSFQFIFTGSFDAPAWNTFPPADPIGRPALMVYRSRTENRFRISCQSAFSYFRYNLIFLDFF